MRIKPFNVNKVQQFLKTCGSEYTFTKQKLNDYNEPVDEIEQQVTILGVFNKSGSDFAVKSTNDGSMIRSTAKTVIFTTWDDRLGYPGGNKIEPDMVITINNTLYKVIGVDDVGATGIAAYIVLEGFDEWRTKT